VAYFAAVLARTDDGWDVSETELDDVETLADLADLAREAAQDDESVLIFIEQEDAWFGVVRVDGEEDPRIFVSDAAAAARSSYGAVLTDELIGQEGDSDFDDLDQLVAELEDEGDGGDEADDSDEAMAEAEGDTDSDDAPADHGAPVGPLGDAELLAEFGMAGSDLRALAADSGDSGDALAEIAEALGFAEVLEAVR
jgi:putative tRNA adenosine deaminase-associated protein